MRCIWAGHAQSPMWPWGYCTGCAHAYHRHGQLEPYFAPGIMPPQPEDGHDRREWHCADYKVRSRRTSDA